MKEIRTVNKMNVFFAEELTSAFFYVRILPGLKKTIAEDSRYPLGM